MLPLPALLTLLALLALPALTACAGEKPAPRECNGSADLCDRRLDDLTLPATHNSMSNAADGWQIPNQEYGLQRQLDDGIRGMLLDTYAWEGDRWFCHGYCELGALRMSEGLATLRTFLDDHPDTVLILILEDHLDAAQTALAFDEAGLSSEFVPLPLPSPLPTLADLIDARTRLLVVSESTDAWQVFSDTPYSFTSVEEMDCSLNRGSAENPLFLVNHWVEDPFPDPDLSAQANTLEVLNARMEECMSARGRKPTLLAVNHYTIGDLLNTTK